jgi:hypothetical protein
LGGSNDLAHGRISQPCWVNAPNDCDWNARSFTHNQLACAREFVGYTNLGDVHDAAECVWCASQVNYSRNSCNTDSNVSETVSPRSSKGVAHNNANIDAELGFDDVSDTSGRTIAVKWQ